MVKTEFYKIIGNKLLVRTYSTTNHRILQLNTNQEFDDAIDEGYLENGNYYPSRHSYIETDKEIEEYGSKD